MNLLRKSFLSILFLVALPAHGAEGIVAVGDVHGAFDPLVTILRQVQVIDEHNDWMAGTDRLVVTGDFLDRGPRILKVMDLLIELEKQAPKQGGHVIVLLGNHEIMNLIGDRRDISQKALSDLQDSRSEIRSQELLKEYRKVARRRIGNRHFELNDRQLAAFHAANPQGIAEYVESLAPKGRYGKWIRSLPTVARVGRGLFIHGGISPELMEHSLQEINSRVEQEIEEWDRCFAWLRRDRLVHRASDLVETMSQIRQLVEAEKLPTACAETARLAQSYLIESEGPFWFRGYSKWTEEEGNSLVGRVLAKYDADYLVVGHTPDPEKGIRSRFSNRVFLIDSGMLHEVYGGRASALIVEDQRISSVTVGETRILKD